MSRHVLIVDSDAQFLPMLKDVFHRVGFEVAVTDARENALHLARSRRPDLILLSVELPAGPAEGYLVCKDFKSDPALSAVPVILISRRAKEEDFVKHRKLKTRADDYLRKPFTDEDLFQRIENLLGFQISNREYLALEEKLHDFLEEKGRLEETIAQRDLRIAELEALLASRAKPIVDSAEVLRLQERVEELETRLERADGERARRQAEAADLRAEVKENSRAIKALDDERKALLEEVEALKAAAAEQEQREEKLKAELAERDGRIAELLHALGEREAALAKATAEAASLNEERNGLAARIKGLTSDAQTAQANAKALESELETLRGEADNLKERLDGLAADLEAARASRRLVEEDLAARTKELAAARKQLGRIRTALAKVVDLLPDENASG